METKSLECILIGGSVISMAFAAGLAHYQTKKAIKILEKTEKDVFGYIIPKQDRILYHDNPVFLKEYKERLKENNLGLSYLSLLSR